MAVTVRQITKRHYRPSDASVNHSWQCHIDRLLNQGHSAEEIQQLLRKAAEMDKDSDQQRLQDVFDYLHAKVKRAGVRTVASGIEFIPTSPRTTTAGAKRSSPSPTLFQTSQSNDAVSLPGSWGRSSLVRSAHHKPLSQATLSIFQGATARSQDASLKRASNERHDSTKSSIAREELRHVPSSQHQSLIDSPLSSSILHAHPSSSTPREC